MTEFPKDLEPIEGYDKAAVIAILMRRDNMTYKEAEALMEECKQMVEEGDDPEEVCRTELGLEPDYCLAIIEDFL